MRVLVIENFAATTLGLVGTALEEAGAELSVIRTFEGPVTIPTDSDGFDALVVLGGAQNALADDTHPELPRIAALTKAFGDADKAVLGICLGAQLVARGYGAENLLDRGIEFGWQPVGPTEAGRSDPVIEPLGDAAPVFHWHSDTFTLPPGAEHLATSDLTRHQAFRIGRAVYGIQFHFEASRALVEEWCEVFADHIAEHTPDWPLRMEEESARHGVLADTVGLEIGRRWVSLIR
ncbi:MAG: GMP synthase [Hyphomicrobiales bacterium]|nr:MAG: GMP synthase [Hyphomicrobiales bacterium]